MHQQPDVSSENYLLNIDKCTHKNTKMQYVYQTYKTSKLKKIFLFGQDTFMKADVSSEEYLLNIDKCRNLHVTRPFVDLREKCSDVCFMLTQVFART